jgi:hypothetical protein
MAIDRRNTQDRIIHYSKLCIFYVQRSVDRECVSVTGQHDATIYSLFMSVNCSTCFGWYLHPSSGAHITVSTASGISVTVTATCRYQPKHVEQFTDTNTCKLYVVVSCWAIIDIDLRILICKLYILIVIYSYCSVCSVLYILFLSCQLALFGYLHWGFSVLFPQL